MGIRNIFQKLIARINRNRLILIRDNEAIIKLRVLHYD
jgi:hypothetical protein